MVYIKNHSSWSVSDKITTSILDNYETQYAEASTYLNTHSHNSSYYTKDEMVNKFWCAENDGPGSGSDADLIYHADGNLDASAFAGLGVPTGLIIMWQEETIPSGYHLCDGTNGTVDLRDRFVVCAGTGSDYNVGDTGTGVHKVSGSVTIGSHSLTIDEIKGHQHVLNDNYAATGSGPCGYTEYGSGYRYPLLTYENDTTGNSNIGKATADGHTHEAILTGDDFTIIPMYYALKYIQKI